MLLCSRTGPRLTEDNTAFSTACFLSGWITFPLLQGDTRERSTSKIKKTNKTPLTSHSLERRWSRKSANCFRFLKQEPRVLNTYTVIRSASCRFHSAHSLSSLFSVKRPVVRKAHGSISQSLIEFLCVRLLSRVASLSPTMFLQSLSVQRSISPADWWCHEPTFSPS